MRCRLAREQLMHGPAGRRLPGAARPFDEELLALRGPEQLEPREAASGVGHGAREQPLPVAEQPPTVTASKRSLECSSAAVSPAGVVVERQDEVEGDVAVGTSSGRSASPGSARRSAGAFCSTSRTWNSGVRARSRSGCSSSTSCSNGSVLVGVGPERRLPRAAQQLARSRLARQVRRAAPAC